MYGRELVEAFREFKSIWDPQRKMNPGKVVDPYPLDINLRAGPRLSASTRANVFSLSRRQGEFRRSYRALFCCGKVPWSQRREQIAQTTERRALHLAEVVAMALRHGLRGPTGALPEAGFVQETARLNWKLSFAMAAMTAAMALLIRRRR
jgi:hypothetical protein